MTRWKPKAANLLLQATRVCPAPSRHAQRGNRCTVAARRQKAVAGSRHRRRLLTTGMIRNPLQALPVYPQWIVTGVEVPRGGETGAGHRSAERDRQQAGAQEHETGHSHCQETVRCEFLTHGTHPCLTLYASPQAMGSLASQDHPSRKQDLCCCKIATSQIKIRARLRFQWIGSGWILTAPESNCAGG